MTIKEKIKEIEVATDELLVPEHDHNVKKTATIVGDLVKDTKEAAGTMLGNDRKKKD